MIDLNKLKYSTNDINYYFKRRDIIFNMYEILDLDKKIKEEKKKLYDFQKERNNISYLISKDKKKIFLKEKIIVLKKNINKKKKILLNLEQKLNKIIYSLPNVLHKTVPKGKSADDNIEIRNFSNYLLNFNLRKKKKLINIESNSEYIDFKLSAKLCGSGFVILKDLFAQLHRALGDYMLDLHVSNHGYKEIYSPLIVTGNTMFLTGHFPKFTSDQFNISNSDLWLIPTSEIILANIFTDKNISYKNLPLKMVSRTPCFRKEKGNYGYKVKGLIRQHQFEKVELLHITEPQKSYDALDELIFNAEKILQNLGLSYRIICLCDKDIGFTASKTYDIEVWLPKHKMYLEVSSCSNNENENR